MKREWVTKNIRAYNLKPGDVVRFWDTRRRREVRRTVGAVDHLDDEGRPSHYVLVRYRRTDWVSLHTRHSLMRIRRLDRS